jgi:hypothetical protein
MKDNATSWISGVQGSSGAGDGIETLSLDLFGAFYIDAVRIQWTKDASGGSLSPTNVSVSISLDKISVTVLKRLTSSSHELAEFAVPGGGAGIASRFVEVRMWDISGQRMYFGVSEVIVPAEDAPLQLLSPSAGAWLTSGDGFDVLWTPLPGVADLSLELLKSQTDEQPYSIISKTDQTVGLYSWSIPELNLKDAGDMGLPLGSDFYLRASRAQGRLGRRVSSVAGPLVLAGNMAKAGVAGSTSWNSLSAQPIMAFDGIRETAWFNDCEMGVGGSSGADVGEVLQIRLYQPGWINSLQFIWAGPRVPSTYHIWFLPLNATNQRTGPGTTGLPNPMDDLSMADGYMEGWQRIAIFTAEGGGQTQLLENGRTDVVRFDVAWPLAADVLRLQIPFDFLASCYPLSEFIAYGVPFVTVTSPTVRTLTKAGEMVNTTWTLPSRASNFASIAENGALSISFNTTVDAVAAGWTPSDTSGWGVCMGKPFSLPSGVVIENLDADAGAFSWDVPCAPGAAGYYLTLEFVISHNKIKISSDQFAISREPDNPKDVNAVEVAARKISASWVPGYDNGEEIREYTVEILRWTSLSRVGIASTLFTCANPPTWNMAFTIRTS